MLEFDSEEDTGDEIFDAEDDLDAEADDDDTVDPLLASMAGGDAADDVTEDGDDVGHPCGLIDGSTPDIDPFMCRTLPLTNLRKTKTKRRRTKRRKMTSLLWI